MANKTDAPAAASSAAGAAAKGAAPKAPNPAFQMMGLPNLRMKLPSRNWMIFFTIVGSWTGAYLYDRREKKRIQQKWCNAVSHLANEPLLPTAMQRRLTVFLSAPPADGLLTAREHFHEYVKPILVAAALDWDAIEGRKEGDVRAMLAEKIRKQRTKNGETGSSIPEDSDTEALLSEIRTRNSIIEYDGTRGDIVIGRNTWKEYIRGLHEGWLGPLSPPAIETSPESVEALPESRLNENLDKLPAERPHDLASVPAFAAEKLMESQLHPSSQSPASKEDASTTIAEDASSEKAPKPEEPPAEKKDEKKRKQPPPYISTDLYSSSSLPRSFPQELDPSATIPLTHILGFRNTPIRMYRFLRKRYEAEDIGRQVAAVVLASHREYRQESNTSDSEFSDPGSSERQPGSSLTWEQEAMLENEEAEWHKSVRNRPITDEKKESLWADKMVLDSRIAGRMRKFILTSEDEQRARTFTGDETTT